MTISPGLGCAVRNPVALRATQKERGGPPGAPMSLACGDVVHLPNDVKRLGQQLPGDGDSGDLATGERSGRPTLCATRRHLTVRR